MISDKLGTQLVSKFLDSQHGAESLSETDQNDLSTYLAQTDSIGRDFAVAITTIESVLARNLAASVLLNEMDNESEMAPLESSNQVDRIPFYRRVSLNSDAKNRMKQSIRDQIRNSNLPSASGTAASLPGDPVRIQAYDLFIVAEPSADYEETNVQPIAESRLRLDDSEAELLLHIQLHMTQQWRGWLKFIEAISLGGVGSLDELRKWILSQTIEIDAETDATLDSNQACSTAWLRKLEFYLSAAKLGDEIPSAPAFIATIVEAAKGTWELRLSFGIPIYAGDTETVLCETTLDFNTMLAGAYEAALQDKVTTTQQSERTILCTDKRRRILGRFPADTQLAATDNFKVVLAPFELHDSSNTRVFLRLA